MVVETGLTRNQIQYACEIAGVEPVKVKQQTLNLIKEYSGKMSIQQFCKKFKFSYFTVSNYLHELGITMLPEPKDKLEIPHTTISERLATVRRDIGKSDKAHYFDILRVTGKEE